jgi:hypothetical protein
MTALTRVSRARRLGGSAALALTAAGFSAFAMHGGGDFGWFAAFVGVLALAAFGLSRKSVIAQVLSRGVAWLVCAPFGIGFLVELALGHTFDAQSLGLAATSGAALALSLPMLRTESAQSEFAPKAYRRLFLAASTASATVGLFALAIGTLASWDHEFGWGMPVFAFGAALVASAIGVLRMRAWGVFLGALTSIVALIAAATAGPEKLLFAAGAVPGLLLALPILLARRSKNESRVRVESAETLDVPLRARVADEIDPDYVAAEETLDAPLRHARLSTPT